MTSHKWHGEAATDLVERLGGEALEKGGGFGAIMKVMEDVMVSVMLINCRVFGVRRHVSAELMEACLHRSLERFTDIMKHDRA